MPQSVTQTGWRHTPAARVSAASPPAEDLLRMLTEQNYRQKCNNPTGNWCAVDCFKKKTACSRNQSLTCTRAGSPGPQTLNFNVLCAETLDWHSLENGESAAQHWYWGCRGFSRRSFSPPRGCIRLFLFAFKVYGRTSNMQLKSQSLIIVVYLALLQEDALVQKGRANAFQSWTVTSDITVASTLGQQCCRQLFQMPWTKLGILIHVCQAQERQFLQVFSLLLALHDINLVARNTCSFANKHNSSWTGRI